MKKLFSETCFVQKLKLNQGFTEAAVQSFRSVVLGKFTRK